MIVIPLLLSCRGTVTVQLRCSQRIGHILARFDGTTDQQHDGIAVGDVNGDGYPDLISGDEVNAKLRCFLGTPKGVSSQANWTIGFPYFGGFPVFSTGDINRDGVDDLMLGGRREQSVSGGYQTLQEPQLFMGRSAGLPATSTFELTGHRAAWSVHFQDVDCTHGKELVLGEGYNETTSFNDVVSAEVYRWSAGIGSLVSGEKVGISGYANSTTSPASFAGDVNGDGCDDLLLISGFHLDSDPKHRSGAAVYRGSKAGLDQQVWYSDRTKLGYPYAGVSLGDVNADGYGDVALLVDEPDTVFKIMLGSDSGKLSALTTMAVPDQESYRVLAAADVNGDGVIDLVSAKGVFLGDGGGFFGTVPALSFVDTRSARAALAVSDVNGDGCQDIFVASRHDTLAERGFGSVTVYAGGDVIEEP